jgi:hypothetical protein
LPLVAPRSIEPPPVTSGVTTMPPPATLTAAVAPPEAPLVAGIDPALCGLPPFPATLAVPATADLERAKAVRKEADGLLKGKQYPQAIAKYKEELLLKPTSNARLQVAKAYAGSGDLERALSALGSLRVPKCPLCVHRLFMAKEAKELAAVRQDPRFATLYEGLQDRMPDFAAATSVLLTRLRSDLAGVVKESLRAGQAIQLSVTEARFDIFRQPTGKPKTDTFVVTSELELAAVPPHPGELDLPKLACTHHCCKLSYPRGQCSSGLALVCFWPVDSAVAVPDLIERRVCVRGSAEVARLDPPPAVTWQVEAGKRPDSVAEPIRKVEAPALADCEAACAKEPSCSHVVAPSPLPPAPFSCELRSGQPTLRADPTANTHTKLLDGQPAAAWLAAEDERYQAAVAIPLGGSSPPPAPSAPSDPPEPHDEPGEARHPDAPAAELPELSIADSAITSAVEARLPKDRLSRVATTTVNAVYAWFEFHNPGASGTVTLVWKHAGVEKWRIDLEVGTSKRWRSSAKKRLTNKDVGEWRVDVIDSGGHGYGGLSFEVVVAHGPGGLP